MGSGYISPLVFVLHVLSAIISGRYAPSNNVSSQNFVYCTDSITQGNLVCTMFGNDLAAKSTSNFKSGLLLMPLSTAAGCAGNATMWNACYYNASTAPLSTVTFAIYHRYAMNNYTLIQRSTMSYTVPRNGSSYSCIHFPIPLTQQFKIQQGDIIAACIQASANRSLNIFGSGAGSNFVWQASTACNSSLRSSVTTTPTPLSATVMHVSLGM